MSAEDDKTNLLARPPVKLAVAQLRFEPHRDVAEASFIRKFADVAGGALGRRIDQATTRQIIAGPLGDTQQFEEKGWSLSSEDGWKTTLLESSVTVETTRYSDWSDFRTRLEAVLAVVESVIAPATEQRVGLRYIDELETDVASPLSWQGLVRNELLGPVLHDGFGASIKTAEHRLVLSYDDGSICQLRHGFSTEQPGGLRYILDTDVSRSLQVVYDGKAIREAFEDFHAKAKDVFVGSLTPDYYERLRTGE